MKSKLFTAALALVLGAVALTVGFANSGKANASTEQAGIVCGCENCTCSCAFGEGPCVCPACEECDNCACPAGEAVNTAKSCCSEKGCTSAVAATACDCQGCACPNCGDGVCCQDCATCEFCVFAGCCVTK